MDNKILGQQGEEYAVKYLIRKGCIILERNYRCRYGEIDIIALDQGILCFIEVKTRTRMDYGLPCQAVDRRKEQHIKKCAYHYINLYHMEDREIRIDIVEVLYIRNHFYIRRLIDGRNG